ncbi:hypothetical protein CLV46_1467 [Diaminobutyricimonas aerilata]|uniref:Uncharacterized protein n=1 Tax=Diaminobutyricimonas aerilata TaxID=1162967 RepID=A0A2M9CJ31_9MICO|nr:hypothetical protein [Diaminobutyricimonas aerilata]PJJ71911.1 hypothetical protein CLV46_1467 [Diaminobutyricimonas aerilata]
MSSTFTLPDASARDDLRTFLGRAQRVEDGSVRLISTGGVLAAYVAVLYPIGLLDETPTVLGLRTVALVKPEDFDAVVPIQSFLHRLELATADADGRVEVAVPHEVATVTWAGISPPRGGWLTLDPTRAGVLERNAKAGIEEVAAAVPTGTGAQLVQRVRTEVWGRPMDELEHVPAGAAFAAVSLGFLGGSGADDEVAILESGPWTRLSTPRGHVLVKRRAWTLAR